jgi:ATP-binding protein involved in chromosome partitioning
MAVIGNDSVLDALRRVPDPERGGDLVSLGMVSGLATKDGHVVFAIEVTPERGASAEPLRQAAEKAVSALPGVLSVTAVLTAERPAGGGARPAPAQDHGHNHGHGHAHAHADDVPSMKHLGAIIAVASGKGGVGKSTTAVNLALALQAEGLTVGILDADVYGPSLPRLLGIKGKPESPDGKKLLPMRAYGLACMSMGFMVPEETPVIWRGPMVMGALQQMLRDVEWGTLDALVVDMPPGTGDAQLTMAQQVPLAGAVIVSTPQDIALIDARKGLAMFRKVDVPVLGIIENMSYFLCPHCGGRSDIFSHGGVRADAERLTVEFLGEIPLDIEIRVTSDGGHPIVASHPDSPHSKVYRAMAKRIWAQVGAQKPSAPRIVVQ